MDNSENEFLLITADIVAAYAGNNSMPGAELPKLIQSVYGALAGLQDEAVAAEPVHVPATSARKSLADPGFIISMIDGKPYMMLKRHLAKHGLTPAEYRQRYGLSSDYPMIAPAYSEMRQALAKRMGLGRKPGTKMKAKATPSTGRKPSAH